MRNSSLNGTGSVELEDLSRFEGEGGPEAPVPATELIDVALENAIGGNRPGRHIKRAKTNDSMKPNIELTEKDPEGVVNCAPVAEVSSARGQASDGENLTPDTPHLAPSASKAGVAERFRRLKWNELVCHGDFVADEHQRLGSWEGPSGFRADSFAKPIYRRQERQPTGAKKLR